MIITAQDKCDGEFFEITGDLDVDLARDAERSLQCTMDTSTAENTRS